MADNRFRIISRSIRVTCYWQDNSWTLWFSDTITLQEIHQHLSDEYGVPRDNIRIVNAKGSPWQLEIYDGCAFTFMDEKSFYRIYMDPPRVLYGCPNVKSVPGVFPDCMIADFDNIDRVEIL